MLDDWDAESTAWLRWSVVDLERLGTIAVERQPDTRPNGPARWTTVVNRETDLLTVLASGDRRGVSRGRAAPRALRRS